MDLIDSLVNRFDLSYEVKEKANDLIRLLNSKVEHGGLRKGDRCREVLMVDLSCRILSVACDRNRLAVSSGLSTKDYQQALSLCRNLLNIREDGNNLMNILAIQVGDASLKDRAKAILRQFAENFVEKLDGAVRARYDLSSTTYAAAAFVLASRNNGVDINQAAIIDGHSLDPKLYRSILRTLEEHVPGCQNAFTKERKRPRLRQGSCESPAGTSLADKMSYRSNRAPVGKTGTRPLMLMEENERPNGLPSQPKWFKANPPDNLAQCPKKPVDDVIVARVDLPKLSNLNPADETKGAEPSLKKQVQVNLRQAVQQVTQSEKMRLLHEERDHRAKFEEYRARLLKRKSTC
jgi:hypothetical protein